MRILVDANVLISAIVFEPSLVSPVVEHVIQNHDFFMTEQIADELIRNALRLRPEMAPNVQEFLNRHELIWIEHLEDEVSIVHRHATDQPILNAAIQNRLDIIISGDKGFHALQIEYPRVIWPADYRAEFIELRE